jgi:hypothetical protein
MKSRPMEKQLVGSSGVVQVLLEKADIKDMTEVTDIAICDFEARLSDTQRAKMEIAKQAVSDDPEHARQRRDDAIHICLGQGRIKRQAETALVIGIRARQNQIGVQVSEVGL